MNTPASRRITAAALLGAVLLAGGCRNACQQLCVRMADYADECGVKVPETQLDACIDANADVDDKQICRDYGDAEVIRNEWSCDDVVIYWDGDPGGDPGGDGGAR